MQTTTSDSIEQKPNVIDDAYVTNPVHGGKVTCHKCNGFITHKDLWQDDHGYFPDAYFHEACFNVYDHYYGLDRPID